MSKSNKLKTHKAAKKRMRLTKNGKILRNRSNKSHLLSHKNGKRIRQLRRKALVHKTMAKTYRKLIRD